MGKTVVQGKTQPFWGGRRGGKSRESYANANACVEKKPKNAKGWLLLLRSSYPLILCLASFAADTCNIVNFFNNGDVVFGSLTLFCLLVPGYFGRRHLLKNKDFFQQSSDLSKTKTIDCFKIKIKTTFLNVFCMATFPIFNVVFKATW